MNLVLEKISTFFIDDQKRDTIHKALVPTVLLPRREISLNCSIEAITIKTQK